MASWPVEPRAGFTGFPNEVLARAVGRLTPEQLRLFIGLVYSAEFRREGSVSPDGRWRIGWAQVLVSYDGLAATYGMKRDAVRRALARFEQVALAMVARVAPATPPAMAAATSPTVVDFGSWYGIEAPGEATTTPSAMAGAMAAATSPAPIQTQEHKNTSSSLRSEGAPPAAAPAAAGSEAGGGGKPDHPPPAAPPPAPKSEFALAVEHWFTAWERAGRGKHARLTEAEGKQLKALLAELGLEELRARMDRALADRWFLEHGDLLAFVRQRNRFARAGAPGAAPSDERRAQAARRAAALEREAASCPEAGKTLFVLSRHVEPAFFDRWLVGLRGARRGQVLEFVAPDPFTAAFVADNHLDALVRAAREATGEPLHVQVVGPSGPGEARA